jgi:hypothetical protein
MPHTPAAAMSGMPHHAWQHTMWFTMHSSCMHNVGLLLWCIDCALLARKHMHG